MRRAAIADGVMDECGPKAGVWCKGSIAEDLMPLMRNLAIGGLFVGEEGERRMGRMTMEMDEANAPFNNSRGKKHGLSHFHWLP